LSLDSVSAASSTFNENQASTMPSSYLSNYSVSDATNYIQYSVSSDKDSYFPGEKINLSGSATLTSGSNRTLMEKVTLGANFTPAYYGGSGYVELIDQAGVDLSTNVKLSTINGSATLIAPSVSSSTTVTIYLAGDAWPWFYADQSLGKRYLFWPGRSTITVTINPPSVNCPSGGVLSGTTCTKYVNSTATCTKPKEVFFGKGSNPSGHAIDGLGCTDPHTLSIHCTGDPDTTYCGSIPVLKNWN